MKKAIAVLCPFFVFFCLIVSQVYADDVKLDMRIDECKDLIDEIMQMPENSIPADLLEKASGIAIFPSVIKGGFVFGGAFGKGIVIHRDKETGAWSAPSFYTIAGGSWGLQIGGQLVDLVLVITNERGMKGILQDKFTVGTDAAASAGPVGRNAEIGTDILLKAGILSYSRSKGLFAGITLKGAVIAPDNKANELYYGKKLLVEEILMGNKVKPSKKAQELIDTIKGYANR
jgi:lipid-binding SYLF domain-containing protein